jgi:ATP-dependent DNA ligase
MEAYLTALAFDLDEASPATVETPLSVFAEMLAKVEATSSKNEKQAIIASYITPDHDRARTLRDLLNLALSPYIRFGVAGAPPADPQSVVMTGEHDRAHRYFAMGIRILDNLATRKLTGNDARETLALYFGALNPDWPSPISEREAFKRILLKDLRAGFSESTVNKARKGTVPVFDCQLAASEMPNIDELQYPVGVEPKYDGVRTIAIKKGGVVTLFSRNGIPFTNFAEIEEELAKRMPDGIVLDGEVLHRDLLGDAGFKLVMKRAKADRGKNVEYPVRYQMFDYMPLKAWEALRCTTQFIDRREALVDTCSSMGLLGAPDSLLRVTESLVAENASDLQSIYEEYVAQGFEGVIVKELDGLYTFKRNKTWQKLKPFATADLVVIGAVEGTGKYVGMLGALIVAGEHEGKKIETEVGSGFTDEQRASFWGMLPLHGRIAEVRYQDITKAEDSETYSLRFPTFLRFRAADAAGKV